MAVLAGGAAAALRLLAAVAVVPALLAGPAAAGAPPFSCGPSSPSRALPFCNAKLPAAQRAADLVSRMTPAEKVSQLGDISPGVPRLGVPGYKWWNEALHGVAISGKGIHLDQGAVRSATSFPQVLLTAAAFDDGLWFRVGQVRGHHTRAFRPSSRAYRAGGMGTRTRTPALMGWVRDAPHGAAPSVGSAGGTGGCGWARRPDRTHAPAHACTRRRRALLSFFRRCHDL